MNTNVISLHKDSEIDQNLYPYRVMLHEEPGDLFQLQFDCMAEDADHAVEQAEDAYPGCEVVHFMLLDDLI